MMCNAARLSDPVFAGRSRGLDFHSIIMSDINIECQGPTCPAASTFASRTAANGCRRGHEAPKPKSSGQRPGPLLPCSQKAQHPHALCDIYGPPTKPGSICRQNLGQVSFLAESERMRAVAGVALFPGRLSPAEDALRFVFAGPDLDCRFATPREPEDAGTFLVAVRDQRGSLVAVLRTSSALAAGCVRARACGVATTTSKAVRPTT